MKSMLSFLLLFLAIVFWLIRLMGAMMFSMDMSFPLVPIDTTMEIVLLFVAIACFVLIIKRKVWGAIIYLLGYGAYFGTDMYNQIISIIENGANATNGLNAFVSGIGLLLPICILLDVAFNKGGSVGGGKKTNWFYENEQFERKLDERADKNQYKF